jgi:DNA-binding CsgD family transcriptional regulator
MRKLCSALEACEEGNGRIVTISGEPGIGKTRCTEELAELASNRGFTVLRGHCQEQLVTPAYWPWVEALEGYIRPLVGEALTDLLGKQAPIVSEFMPSIRLKIPDLDRPLTATDSKAAEFRLLYTAFELVRDVSSNAPLMIVLEDLHWSDVQTLKLIEFFAPRIRSLRLLLIGSYRDVEVSRKHPLSSTLGELARSDAYERIEIKRLSESAMLAYIDRVASSSISDYIIRLIVERTEGNPLFLQEIVYQYNDDPKAVTIAEGIREAIGRRLDQLTDECNHLLAISAVIGRAFTVQQLETLDTALDEKGIASQLEEAIHLGIIVEEMASVFGGYRFSHALIQETLLEEIPITVRVRMHAEIAETLERRYGAEKGEHVSELLYHHTHARPLLGPGKVVRYAILAGDRALEAHASEEAARCFETGLDALGDDAPMDDEKAALFFGLGRAFSYGARGISGERNKGGCLLESFDYYVRTNQTDRAVAVASSAYAGTLDTDLADIIRMYETALELVERDSIEEARICSFYSKGLQLARRNPERVIAQHVRAHEVARKHNDPNLEMFTLSAWATAEDWQGRPAKALLLLEDASRIVQGDDLYTRAAICRATASLHYRYSSDMDAARRYYAEAHRLAKITRIQYGTSLQMQVQLLHRMGKWEEARSVATSDPDIPYAPFLFLELAGIEYELGNTREGEAHLNRVIDHVETSDGTDFWGMVGLQYFIPNIVRRGANMKYLEVAELYAPKVQAVLRAAGWENNSFYDLTALVLALISAVKGEVTAAKEHYANAAAPPDEWTGYPNYDFHGYICRVIGDLDASLRYLAFPEEYYEKSGMQASLAWVRYDIACTLLEMGDNKSLNGAKDRLERAGSIAHELDMIPLSKLIEEKSMELESLLTDEARSESKTAKNKIPAGLTKREFEVLVHLALGKTNQEIGRDLYISTKTVHNHLSHIFGKLNVGNRTEAARAAFRMGIDGNRTSLN